MKKSTKIAGLYLWLITVRYYSRYEYLRPVTPKSMRLWITTPTENIDRAIDKARALIKRDHDVKNAKVTTVEPHGTIDA
jgi:hypothetical protein